MDVNFDGQFAGSFVTTGCVETAFVGLCDGLGFDSSKMLPLTVSFTQKETSVTGTIVLGVTPSMMVTLGSSTTRAAFQGAVQSGHLHGTAVIANVPYCVTAPADPRLPGGGGYSICGLGMADRITAWDATITDNTLSGSFSWTFNYPGAALFNGAQMPGSTATVTANLFQVHRQ